VDVVVAAAAALKEHDDWREAEGLAAPYSAFNYQQRAVTFLDAMSRFGCDPRQLASVPKAASSAAAREPVSQPTTSETGQEGSSPSLRRETGQPVTGEPSAALAAGEAFLQRTEIGLPLPPNTLEQARRVVAALMEALRAQPIEDISTRCPRCDFKYVIFRKTAPSTPSAAAIEAAAQTWGDWELVPDARPRLLRFAEVALRAAYAVDALRAGPKEGP